MRVHPLRSYNLPDVGEYLIHFTGRSGGRVDEVPQPILDQRPDQRLWNVLVSGCIDAYPQFHAPVPVSCFTESVPASLKSLIASGRYTPHGVGFTKQFIFDLDGGPVWYLRGDRLREVHAGLSAEAQSMTVRYWPGAEPTDEDSLPGQLRSSSEWLHEREWRVLGSTSFTPADVAFVIVPVPGSLIQLASWVEQSNPEQAALWRAVPEVVISEFGGVLQDPLGIFAG